MSAAGAWLVDFDWGLDDKWEVITVVLDPDGTWSAGGGQSHSNWIEQDGMVLMMSAPPGAANTVFCATRVGDAMVGASSDTLGSFTGVWRARRIPGDVSLEDDADAEEPTDDANHRGTAVRTRFLARDR